MNYICVNKQNESNIYSFLRFRSSKARNNLMLFISILTIVLSACDPKSELTEDRSNRGLAEMFKSLDSTDAVIYVSLMNDFEGSPNSISIAADFTDIANIGLDFMTLEINNFSIPMSTSPGIYNLHCDAINNKDIFNSILASQGSDINIDISGLAQLSLNEDIYFPLSLSMSQFMNSAEVDREEDLEFSWQEDISCEDCRVAMYMAYRGRRSHELDSLNPINKSVDIYQELSISDASENYIVSSNELRAVFPSNSWCDYYFMRGSSEVITTRGGHSVEVVCVTVSPKYLIFK